MRVVAPVHRVGFLPAFFNPDQFVRRPLVPPGVLPPVGAPRRLLPFRLRRKTLAPLLAVRLRLVPGHSHHGLLGTVEFLSVVFIWLHPRRTEASIRHRILVNVVGIQINTPGGFLIRLPIAVVVSPNELTGRNQDHGAIPFKATPRFLLLAPACLGQLSFPLFTSFFLLLPFLLRKSFSLFLLLALFLSKSLPLALGPLLFNPVPFFLLPLLLGDSPALFRTPSFLSKSSFLLKFCQADFFLPLLNISVTLVPNHQQQKNDWQSPHPLPASRRRRVRPGRWSFCFRRRGSCLLPVHHPAPLRDALGTLLPLDAEGAVNGGKKPFAEFFLPRLDGRHHRVAHDARDRLRRRRAADELVDHRSKGVDVRPGALRFARGGVLLYGGVAGGDDSRQAAASRAQGLPRRAEVDQNGHLVLVHDDVARLDVAVEDSGIVDQLEPLQE